MESKERSRDRFGYRGWMREMRVSKLPPELNKSARWITMWRGFMSTDPISATNCSVLEAGWKPSTPGFKQAPDTSATLGGALFNKADRRQVLQRWKCKHGRERLGTRRFSQESKGSVDQREREKNFMAARALDFLVCGAIKELHLPADGSSSQTVFLS